MSFAHSRLHCMLAFMKAVFYHFTMRMLRCLMVMGGLMVGESWANPEVAQGVRQEYQTKMEVWALSLRAAATAEEQQKRWQERPDAALYAGKMWTALRSSLHQEWTLDPAAWLVKLLCAPTSERQTPELVALRKEVLSQVLAAIDKQHWSSAKMASMCFALYAMRDSRSLPLLEKIEKSNPDRTVQGVAALAIAMLLQDLSDDGKTMQRRLTLIRKAIIESAHCEIDGVTVAKMAEDQLYVIRFLSKNRVAPDLAGVDVTGAPGKLSEYGGKVVVLLFWNSAAEDHQRVLEIHRDLVKKMAKKPFVLIGVTSDATESVRSMQAEGLVTWRNFLDPEGELAKQFRVSNFPICYVLDHERKIQYVGAPGSFVELTADALVMDVKPE